MSKEFIKSKKKGKIKNLSFSKNRVGSFKGINGMNLFSIEFMESVLSILENKYGKSAMEIKPGLKIVNNDSPSFYTIKKNSDPMKSMGFIKDFADTGDVEGNILHFLLSHIKSPVYNNPEAFANLLEINIDEFNEYTQNRKPGRNSEYNKETVITEIVPNWLWEMKLSQGEIDKVYLNGRGINQEVVNDVGVRDLKNLENPFDTNIEEKTKLFYDFVESFAKTELKFETELKKGFNKKKIVQNFIEFAKTKISILKDFLYNLEVESNVKLDMANLILNTNKTMIEFQEEFSLEKEVKITIEDLRAEHKTQQNENWFKEYFSRTKEQAKEQSIAIPLRENGKVKTIFYRNDGTSGDKSKRYTQTGKSIAETELKQYSKYLFVIEGKMDELSIKTMMKEIGEEDYSIVTLANAGVKVPYEVNKFIHNNPYIKIIPFFDNDQKGDFAKEEFLSKLFDKNKIEQVYKFNDFLKEEKIQNNDLNDFLVDGSLSSSKFKEFLDKVKQYKTKIQTKITKVTNNGFKIKPEIDEVFYFKNTSELKKLFETIKYYKREEKELLYQNKTMYIKIGNKILQIPTDTRSMYQLSKAKNIEEFESILDNLHLLEKNILFLEKDKKYHHSEVYTNAEKVYLIENKNSFLNNKNIYELPVEKYDKNNDGKEVNKTVEQFIYDNANTAQKLACNEKLESKEYKVPEFDESNNIINFSSWWSNKLNNNISGINISEETRKELKEEGLKELNLIKGVHENLSIKVLKSYLEKKLELNLIKFIKSNVIKDNQKLYLDFIINKIDLTDEQKSSLKSINVDNVKDFITHIEEDKSKIISEDKRRKIVKEIHNINVVSTEEIYSHFSQNNVIIGQGIKKYSRELTKEISNIGEEVQKTYKEILLEGRLSTKFLEMETTEMNEVKEKIKVEQKDYLNYFLEFNSVMEELKEQNVFTNTRGSANNFISVSLFDWNMVHPDLLKKMLELKEDFLMPERFIAPNKVSMADIDVEVKPSQRETALDVVQEQGKFLFLVKKYLEATDETQFAIHPCKMTDIPQELKSFFTEETEYIPYSTEDLNGKDERAIDIINTKYERKTNAPGLSLKLKDILFKDLLQITSGVQEALIYQKDIEFPTVERMYIKRTTKGGETVHKSYIKTAIKNGPNYLDNNGNLLSEEDIKKSLKEEGIGLKNNENLPKPYNVSFYNLLKTNSITEELLIKFFPTEYNKLLEVMDLNVSIEELMAATSTNRPAFTNRIYKINDKLFRHKKTEEEHQLINIDNTSEVLNQSEIPLSLLNEFNEGDKDNKGSYYSMEEKENKNNFSNQKPILELKNQKNQKGEENLVIKFNVRITEEQRTKINELLLKKYGSNPRNNTKPAIEYFKTGVYVQKNQNGNQLLDDLNNLLLPSLESSFTKSNKDDNKYLQYSFKNLSKSDLKTLTTKVNSLIKGETNINKKKILTSLETSLKGNKFFKLWSNQTYFANELKSVLDSLNIQQVNDSFYQSIPLYKVLKERQKEREFFPSLNKTYGSIMLQEQMMNYITTIADEYKKYTPNLPESFHDNWVSNSDVIRKYAAKVQDRLKPSDIEKANEIFSKLKEFLSEIEKQNPNFTKEALEIFDNQFFSLEKGAYLYNGGHGLLVAYNAIQESIYKQSKEDYRKEWDLSNIQEQIKTKDESKTFKTQQNPKNQNQNIIWLNGLNNEELKKITLILDNLNTNQDYKLYGNRFYMDIKQTEDYNKIIKMLKENGVINESEETKIFENPKLFGKEQPKANWSYNISENKSNPEQSRIFINNRDKSFDKSLEKYNKNNQEGGLKLYTKTSQAGKKINILYVNNSEVPFFEKFLLNELKNFENIENQHNKIFEEPKEKSENENVFIINGQKYTRINQNNIHYFVNDSGEPFTLQNSVTLKSKEILDFAIFSGSQTPVTLVSNKVILNGQFNPQQTDFNASSFKMVGSNETKNSNLHYPITKRNVMLYREDQNGLVKTIIIENLEEQGLEVSKVQNGLILSKTPKGKNEETVKRGH